MSTLYSLDTPPCPWNGWPGTGLLSLTKFIILCPSNNDPYIPVLPPFRKYYFKLKSSPLTKGLLQKIDAVVVVTDHSCIDYPWVVKHAPLVIDTRNVTRDMKRWKKKIIKA